MMKTVETELELTSNALRAEIIKLNNIIDEYKYEGVTDVNCNSDGKIWIEAGGEKFYTEIIFEKEERMSFARMLAGENDKIVDYDHPEFSVAYPGINGSRIQITIPPVVTAATFDIRLPPPKTFTMQEFVDMETITEEQRDFLLEAIASDKNILVAGATGSGKTTLARTLINQINKNDRLMIIQDTPEIVSNIPNKDYMFTSENFTLQDAIRLSMRRNQDKIIVGEIRSGHVAVACIDAFCTGHTGITTIHASSGKKALDRIAKLQKQVILTPDEDEIRETINVVVFMKKEYIGGRSVRKVKEIYQPTMDIYNMRNVVIPVFGKYYDIKKELVL